MDYIFVMEQNDRLCLIKTIAQNFRCTYICLWSYISTPNNCLYCMERWYDDDSSAGSVPSRLFEEYCQHQSFYTIENSCVPGRAFMEGLPYLELHQADLLNCSTNDIQRQFYQAAGIQAAIFSGCRSGEIELGMSLLNFNMEAEFRKLLPEDFQQSQLLEARLPDYSRPSSSSSSLRSLSVGSPEYSFLSQMNIASSSYLPDAFQETPIDQASQPTSTALPTHQQVMQAYSRSRNVQFPTPASDDAAMARAMLAVISSSSSSSSSYQAQQTQMHLHQEQTQRYPQQATERRGAFKHYTSALVPKMEIKPKSGSQNLMMRALDYMKSIRTPMQETRPTSNQLHHMISERKRRVKLNESFQALKELLPPGSKKDKASVLANTRTYLTSLKEQISELQEKNRLLETQLAPTKQAHEEATIGDERVVIRVIEASESSSAERAIELHVMVREEDYDVVDFLISLLECLKQMDGVSLASMEADTQLHQTTFHRAIFRLKIKAGNWDEQSFKEAMTRAIADVARRGGPSS